MSDDILFGMTMLNDEFAKIVLSIILDKKVIKIKRRSVQKVFPNLPGYKSIRLDVIVELSDGTLCNVEMQTVSNDNMSKRSRFYQGILDAVTLYSGETVKYQKLPKTIITEFDVFGEGLYKYTFENECQEVSGLKLGDGCIKIFLNTKGKLENNEPKELINFLKFVHESSEKNASVNKELWHLYEILQTFKKDDEKERDYMNAVALRDDYLEEGRREGEQRLSKLIKSLQSAGRTEEISKVLDDGEYRKKLLKEYNLFD